MWGTILRDWTEFVFYVIGIGAAILSVWQFRRNSKQERIRWMFEMHRRFYAEAGLGAMRMKIDEGDTQFVQEEKDTALLGQLDNYLNFFEFLAYLWSQKQLSKAEILAMFEFPLKDLSANTSVLDYIWKWGYEWLGELLKELGYPRVHEA
jgi:hypothetical protein